MSFSFRIRAAGAGLLLLLASAALQVSAAEATLPEACTTGCVAPYGKLLGTGAGEVPAYSNCDNDCVVFEPHKHEGIYTGIRWQCVEYARRWLLVNEGVVYGDVDYAIDIWDKIDHYTRVADGSKVSVTAHLNGSTVAPRKGDLLIYAKAFFGTGHVAVVTGVDDVSDALQVAEQNFGNTPWQNDYSRRLEVLERDGRFWVLDPYLIGWKRMVVQ